MKHLYLIALFASCILTGCSDDTAETTDNQNTEEEVTFPLISSMYVGLADFPTESPHTSFIENTSPNGRHTRIFTMGGTTGVGSPRSLRMEVHYDNTKDKIDGTYTFGTDITGVINILDRDYLFDTGEGSVEITDLGNSYYKLVFEDMSTVRNDIYGTVFVGGMVQLKFTEEE